jgi:hypothetical protein
MHSMHALCTILSAVVMRTTARSRLSAPGKRGQHFRLSLRTMCVSWFAEFAVGLRSTGQAVGARQARDHLPTIDSICHSETAFSR